MTPRVETSEVDGKAVRRLVGRLRERCDRHKHHVGEPLRDLLLTAAATLEHQQDVIAATRCDCAARALETTGATHVE